MLESDVETSQLMGQTQTLDERRVGVFDQKEGNGQSRFKKRTKYLTEGKVGKPYKLASRESFKKSTIVSVDGIKIGGQEIVVMAGPCSVESGDQIMSIAKKVKKSGASILRGGAYKPRTSPYDFQGLGETGLKLIREAADKYSLSVITEVLDPRDVEMVGKYTDIFQIGSRSMDNVPLLKEVGRTKTPVLLKRGMCATYKEFLLKAEYIMLEGNNQVILCERGLRSYVPELRNMTDMNAIPYLKRETHLPVILDPSHSTGRSDLVEAISLAGVAAGADGLLIESHIHPKKSISDADQAISIRKLSAIIKKAGRVARAIGRDIIRVLH